MNIIMSDYKYIDDEKVKKEFEYLRDNFFNWPFRKEWYSRQKEDPKEHEKELYKEYYKQLRSGDTNMGFEQWKLTSEVLNNERIQ